MLWVSQHISYGHYEEWESESTCSSLPSTAMDPVLTYSSIPAHWPFMLSSSACFAAIQQLWGSSLLFMSPKSTLTAAPSLPPMALMPLDQIFLHPWPFCALMSLFQDEKKPKAFSLNRIKYHKSFLKISSQWKRVSFLIRKDMSVPHGV